MNLGEVFQKIYIRLSGNALAGMDFNVCPARQRIAHAKTTFLVYPSGIVGVVLAAWLYFYSPSPLYADGVLNLYHLCNEPMVGTNGPEKKKYSYSPISWCTSKGIVQWYHSIHCFLVSHMGLCSLFYQQQCPPSWTPLFHHAATAMWWMALRKIEKLLPG